MNYHGNIEDSNYDRVYNPNAPIQMKNPGTVPNPLDTHDQQPPRPAPVYEPANATIHTNATTGFKKLPSHLHTTHGSMMHAELGIGNGSADVSLVHIPEITQQSTVVDTNHYLHRFFTSIYNNDIAYIHAFLAKNPRVISLTCNATTFHANFHLDVASGLVLARDAVITSRPKAPRYDVPISGLSVNPSNGSVPYDSTHMIRPSAIAGSFLGTTRYRHTHTNRTITGF